MAVTATENYLNAQDRIGAWIEDWCNYGPSGFLSNADAWPNFKNWAEASNEFAGKKRDFLDDLAERPGVTRDRDHAKGRGFRGIELKVFEKT